MAAPSVVSSVIFVAIVVVVAGMFVSAWRVSAGGPWSRAAVPALVLVGWLVAPGVLAGVGALDRYGPGPAPAMVLIALITLGTVALALSPVGGRIVSATPLAALVGFQFFRVPVEWVLHRLYLEGVIPVQMTWSGRNYDIVSGLSAAVVAMLLVAGRGRRLVPVWNLLALVLLANIVTVAVLSTPVPFRHFMNEPANRLPSMFPYVWLPTFLVQAALFGHLLVFRAGMRGARGR